MARLIIDAHGGPYPVTGSEDVLAAIETILTSYGLTSKIEEETDIESGNVVDKPEA